MRGGLCTREAKALTDHDTQRLKMNPEEYVGRMLEEYEEAKALNGFGQGLIGEGGRQLRADGRSSAGSGGRAPNSNGSGATSSTRPVEVPLEEADELDGNHNLKSMIPEPTANVHEASWTGPFSVINNYNVNGDETLPTDFTRMDKRYMARRVSCAVPTRCRTSKYFLWPPENQRTQILTMAARLAEEGNPVTDPHANFVQFRKDITLCNDGQ